MRYINGCGENHYAVHTLQRDENHKQYVRIYTVNRRIIVDTRLSKGGLTMVSAKNADKLQVRRPSASQQIKRALYLMSTAPVPTANVVSKKPSYLRYIEYV